MRYVGTEIEVFEETVRVLESMYLERSALRDLPEGPSLPRIPRNGDRWRDSRTEYLHGRPRATQRAQGRCPEH